MASAQPRPDFGREWAHLGSNPAAAFPTRAASSRQIPPKAAWLRGWRQHDRRGLRDRRGGRRGRRDRGGRGQGPPRRGGQGRRWAEAGTVQGGAAARSRAVGGLARRLDSERCCKGCQSRPPQSRRGLPTTGQWCPPAATSAAPAPPRTSSDFRSAASRRQACGSHASHGALSPIPPRGRAAALAQVAPLGLRVTLAETAARPSPSPARGRLDASEG